MKRVIEMSEREEKERQAKAKQQEIIKQQEERTSKAPALVQPVLVVQQ
jgi:hypothetical protein